MTDPKTGALVREEFGATETHEMTEVSTTAAAAQAQALVQARFIMAIRNPRDLMQVRQRMLADAKRPGFAKVAIYSVPRGGKQITGASIRFAEEPPVSEARSKPLRVSLPSPVASTSLNSWTAASEVWNR